MVIRIDPTNPTKLCFVDLSNYEPKQEGAGRSINLYGFPLGLMSLATVLNNNFTKLDIELLDFGIDYGTKEDLIEKIVAYAPDYIGMRALSTNETLLGEVIGELREKLPKAFFLVGGPYSSGPTEDDFKRIKTDVFVIGEAEQTVVKLFKKLLAKEDYSDVNGIAFMKDGTCQKNPPMTCIPAMDDIPFPDYELIDYEKYFSKVNWGYTRSKYALLESTRGCPYQCIYCHNIFGKRPRYRSAESMFKEIKRLHGKYGMEDFFFVDDIFNLNYDRTEKIFDMIIKSGMKVKLHFPNGLRGDLLDENIIDKMVEAGGISTALAVETPVPRMQKLIGKHLNLEKLKENIHYACEKGIMVRLFFMYGFPTETEEDINFTIDYMKQFKKAVLPYLFSTIYYKNTKMYDMALKEGFTLQELQDSQKGLYNEVQYLETPLLSKEFLKQTKHRWMKEVILNKERMTNALAIQRKYLIEDDIKLFYSSFFGREITDLDRVLKMCN
ncbi:MAG: B12-binding domain-containing radical SAM protein [Nanoarchaeota archaeon]|nr:B12-binding domain-containing radical SAM protein [Nanoarchaeota archaeon]